MFSLRKETDYALQLLKKLSKQKDEAVSLKKMSEELDISFLFLQKIARKLRLAGYIEAIQGVNGGYRLKQKPKDLSLRDIIKTMEGDCAVMACLEKDGKPCREKCCIRSKFKKINSEIIKILDKFKLSDL